MYINPYWAGVLTVIVAEIVLFFAAALIKGLKKKGE